MHAIWQSLATQMIPPNTDATGVFGWFFAALAVLAAVTAFAVARTTKAKLLAELRARADHDTLVTAQQKELRLASIGNLAAGIAHDLNNLLTVVSGAAEIAQQILGEHHQASELLLEIQTAVQRGSRFTQQMQTFASKQNYNPQPVDLGSLVGELSPMLQRMLGMAITMQLLLPKECAWVTADRAQLEQVLLSLGQNAGDAMPQGGTLRIEVVTTLPLVYTLRVIDHGCGMSKDAQEHVFEPFFTTKHRSRNHGLGLATSYGIVKRFGGSIGIESREGSGTTVTVTLPRIRAPRTVVATTHVASIKNCTVLLIDDHEAVRCALQQMLTAMGASVIAAIDGDDAIANMHEQKTPIDIIISDVVMPGLQGTHLVDAILAVQPDVPILFLSGYAGLEGPCSRLRERGFVVLTKPVSAEALAAAVLKSLATRTAASAS
ncbi:MAG: ATP-binding protein [Planctomycetota bacterium]